MGNKPAYLSFDVGCMIKDDIDDVGRWGYVLLKGQDKQRIVPACQHDEISNTIIDQAECDEHRAFTLPMVKNSHPYQLS